MVLVVPEIGARPPVDGLALVRVVEQGVVGRVAELVRPDGADADTDAPATAAFAVPIVAAEARRAVRKTVLLRQNAELQSDLARIMALETRVDT